MTCNECMLYFYEAHGANFLLNFMILKLNRLTSISFWVGEKMPCFPLTQLMFKYVSMLSGNYSKCMHFLCYVTAIGTAYVGYNYC